MPIQKYQTGALITTCQGPTDQRVVMLPRRRRPNWPTTHWKICVGDGRGYWSMGHDRMGRCRGECSGGGGGGVIRLGL